MTRHASFPPVADVRTRILILGSLPGAASLAAGRYYAHPRNQFWRLLDAVFDLGLAGLDYETRLERLLAHRIGLWDVIARADRVGSLDAAIRDPAANNLSALVASLPALRTIGFNGGTAARIGAPLLAEHNRLRLVNLPSSSPAHAVPFEAKRTAWRQLLNDPIPVIPASAKTDQPSPIDP